MLIDLDRFKHVNDSLGHPTGDKLLQRVAKRMREMAGEGDMVARLGGDEFVFLRRCERDEAGWFAAQAVETLSEPYHVDNTKLLIGASIGIAMAPRDGANAAELMKSADMALYAAKDAGRGAHRFFDKSMADNALRKQELEHDLRIGIGRNELEVHYQPIVSLAKRRISACEALVRWRHPTQRHGVAGRIHGNRGKLRRRRPARRMGAPPGLSRRQILAARREAGGQFFGDSVHARQCRRNGAPGAQGDQIPLGAAGDGNHGIGADA